MDRGRKKACGHTALDVLRQVAVVGAEFRESAMACSMSCCGRNFLYPEFTLKHGFTEL